MDGSRERQGALPDIHGQSAAGLRLLLRRQESLLSGGDTALRHLPDKGVKVRSFVLRLRTALAAAEARESSAPLHPVQVHEEAVLSATTSLVRRRQPVTLRAAPGPDVDSLASELEARLLLHGGGAAQEEEGLDWPLELTPEERAWAEDVAPATAREPVPPAACTLDLQATAREPVLVVFDLETNKLGADAAITQLGALYQDEEEGVLHSFCEFCLPPRMEPSASRTTGMTLRVVDGRLALLRAEQRLPTVPLAQVLRTFFNFLVHASSQGRRQVVLVAHNGHRFDFPVLLSNLRRCQLAEQLLSATCSWLLLADSLLLFRQLRAAGRISSPNCQLQSLVQALLPGFEYAAHDALEDCRALRSLLVSAVLGNDGSSMAELLHLSEARPSQYLLDMESAEIRRVTALRSYRLHLSTAGTANNVREHFVTAGEAEKLALAGIGMPELRRVALAGWRRFVALIQCQSVQLDPPALRRVFRAGLAAEQRMARYAPGRSDDALTGSASIGRRATQLLSLQESASLQRAAALRHGQLQEAQAAAALARPEASAGHTAAPGFSPEGSGAFGQFREPAEDSDDGDSDGALDDDDDEVDD